MLEWLKELDPIMQALRATLFTWARLTTPCITDALGWPLLTGPLKAVIIPYWCAAGRRENWQLLPERLVCHAEYELTLGC